MDGLELVVEEIDEWEGCFWHVVHLSHLPSSQTKFLNSRPEVDVVV